MSYRNGIPKSAYRALDYTAASIGTILRNGPPTTPEAFASLADELELIRQLCQCAVEFGPCDPLPSDPIKSEALRSILLQEKRCVCGENWPCTDSRRTDIRPDIRASHYVRTSDR